MNFFKANYVQLERHLSAVDWCGELGEMDLDSAVDRLYEIIERFLGSIPKTIPSTREYPVYYDYHFISLIKKKAALKAKLKKAESVDDRLRLSEEFTEVRTLVKRSIKECLNDCVCSEQSEVRV